MHAYNTYTHTFIHTHAHDGSSHLRILKICCCHRNAHALQEAHKLRDGEVGEGEDIGHLESKQQKTANEEKFKIFAKINAK